jgi:assimilatory nitrate reductase catalytic subunit
MISRQRRFFDAPGEARADWDIIAEVGRRMGHPHAFAWPNAAAVFREYCAQTAFENNGARKLDLSAWAELSDADYDALKPMRWGGPSPFADKRFTTPSGRARMIAVQPPAAPVADPAYPFRLNTSRYRDQWHTMTRTALSPRLSQHRREPLVEVHPQDAAALGIEDGGLARVTTAQGEAVFRVALSDGQRRSELCVPMHWTDQISAGGRANRLPNQNADPVSTTSPIGRWCASVLAGSPNSPDLASPISPRCCHRVPASKRLMPFAVLAAMPCWVRMAGWPPPCSSLVRASCPRATGSRGSLTPKMPPTAPRCSPAAQRNCRPTVARSSASASMSA